MCRRGDTLRATAPAAIASNAATEHTPPTEMQRRTVMTLRYST